MIDEVSAPLAMVPSLASRWSSSHVARLLFSPSQLCPCGASALVFLCEPDYRQPRLAITDILVSRVQTADRVDSTLESLTTGAKKGKKKETLMSSWMGPDYSKLCARGLVERSDLEVVQV